MTRFPALRILGLVATLLLGVVAGQAHAEPPPFAFLPPEVAPQELCPPAGAAPAGTSTNPAARGPRRVSQERLLSFLRRDIRAFTAEDADRRFDFITRLIRWQQEIDPGFDRIDAELARIALHVDAGRLAQLRAAGLVEGLRGRLDQLSPAQKARLAPYFLTGTGVDPDPAFGQALLREAALDGDPGALLAIADMADRGKPLPGWDTPVELTRRLGFQGLLGAVNPGICSRAQRLADIYLAGEVVARDPAAAYAWLVLAADLGGAEAAWRVAEAHLAGWAPQPDGAVLRHYLDLALARGYPEGLTTPETARTLRARLLGPESGAGPENGPGPFLQLGAAGEAAEPGLNAPLVDYLRRLAALPDAPGSVFVRLAAEIELGGGRWVAEAEIAQELEEAARRGDAGGMRRLAAVELRHRDDPVRLSRAISLLSAAATREGDPAAMRDLDRLFCCQLPDAPALGEADYWAGLYRAATGPLDVETGEVPGLDLSHDPEAFAAIQSRALAGNGQALALMVERAAFGPADGPALRYWAGRAQRSAKALEFLTLQEMARAGSPVTRAQALALMRRIQVHNGAASALELAVTLIAQEGRDPGEARTVIALLEEAGNRGEGAAIRLLARLAAAGRLGSMAPGLDDEAAVFARFARAIDERGDFLALTFAISHVKPEQARDYLARAVSVMECTSGEVSEMRDAVAHLGDDAAARHWGRVAEAIGGTTVQPRLGLGDRQIALFGAGAMPSAVEALARSIEEGNPAALRSLYRQFADPGSLSHDLARAAEALAALAADGDAEDREFVRHALAVAPPALRAASAARAELVPLLRETQAEGGAGENRQDIPSP